MDVRADADVFSDDLLGIIRNVSTYSRKWILETLSFLIACYGIKYHPSRAAAAASYNNRWLK